MVFADPPNGPSVGPATERLALRMITADDAQLDYEAVMDSREMLRLWQQSTWPADDFTVAENRADLETMARANAARTAYGYTVLSPGGDHCLGCVYIFPPSAPFLARSAVRPVSGSSWHGGPWEDVGAAVYLWVRSSRLADGLDRELLSVLRTWLAHDWDLPSWVFVTAQGLAPQVQMLEQAGLSPAFEIREPGTAGTWIAYG